MSSQLGQQNFRSMAAHAQLPDLLLSPATGSSGRLPPLRFSLPLLLLAFGLGLILFQFLSFTKVDEDRARRSISNQCKHTGQRMALSLGRMLNERRVDAIRSDIKRLMNMPGVLDAVVVNDQQHILVGERVSWTGKPAVGLLSTQVVAALQKALLLNHRYIEASEDRSGMVGVFPLNTREPSLFILELDLKEPLQEARNAAVARAMSSGSALLVACAGLWLVLNKVVTQRAQHILEEARAMSTGETRGRPLLGADELAQIDQALRETHQVIARQAATLRAREERHRRMVESLPAMVFVLRDQCVEYINGTGLKMLGLSSAEQVVGKPLSNFLPPRFREEILQRGVEALTSATPQPSIEAEIVRCDGATLAVESVLSSFKDEHGPALQVVMHDISERKVEEARREALSREITNASEREQRRIGQDLHDDICQRLAAVKMNMQDLEETLAEHAPVLVDEADTIVERLTDAIRITRTLARGLSPVDIEAGGLGTALTGLVRSSRELLGIECHLQMPDELPPLAAHAATQFYRIAQECITNAAKHGHAEQVWVSLAEMEQELIMRVSNNGLPFHPGPSTDSSMGMGLPIMRYRAQSMDAVLLFEPSPTDAAVAVRCTLPLIRSSAAIL